MKNKKSIAMAMAAVSSLGAVAPAFAAEITPIETQNNLNVALSEGNKVQVMTYGEVYDTHFTADKKDDTVKKGLTIYDTHFTADKKDDTVKKGLTILDVISNEENKESYLVASALTIEDVRESNTYKKEDLEKKLAKMIATEKTNLEDTIKEIKHKLTLSYINDKGEKKALYTIDEKKSGEVQAEETEKRDGNFYQLVLVKNDVKEDNETVYSFNNIKFEEKAT